MTVTQNDQLSTGNVKPREGEKVRHLEFSDFRALRDFRAFEVVNTMRLSLSLDGYRTVILIGSITVLTVGLAVCILLFSTIRQSPTMDRQSIGLLAVATATYFGCLIIFGEVYSGRRIAVSGNPHLALFKSLDIPLQHVLIRYGLLPLFIRMFVFAGCIVVYLGIFWDPSIEYTRQLLLLSTILIFVLSAGIYSVLKCSVQPPSRQRRGWVLALAPGSVGVLVGLGTSGLLPSVRESERSLVFLREHAVWLCPPLLVSASILILLSVRMWKRLSYQLVEPPREGRRKCSGARTLFQVIWIDLLTSKQGSLIMLLVLAWSALLGVLVGLRWGSVFPIVLPSDQLERGLISIAILMTLSFVEPMLLRTGPTSKRSQYRFSWENGGSHRKIVASATAHYALCGAIAGFLVLLAGYLVFDQWIFASIPASLVATAAALLAECLTSPPVSTDGTKAADLLEALVTMVLIAPCAMVLALGPEFNRVFLALYALLLLLGVSFCLRERIFFLRSRSRL